MHSRYWNDEAGGGKHEQLHGKVALIFCAQPGHEESWCCIKSVSRGLCYLQVIPFGIDHPYVSNQIITQEFEEEKVVPQHESMIVI